MTLLGGLFSRKNKRKHRDGQLSSVTSAASVAIEELDSTLSSSPTTDYVTPDKYVPSVPNGKSSLHPDPARAIRTNLNDHHHHPSLETMPSSSKLRIFSRKKSSIKPPEYDAEAPRPHFMGTTSAASDAESADIRRLRPPPSKSAIFAAYTDSHSALSTRSLPSEAFHIPSSPPAKSAPLPKRPSLFAWTRSSTTKSTPAPAKQSKKLPHIETIDRCETPESSFNLKSFRHVGPSNPSTHANSSNGSLNATNTPPARPRPDPANSDSSQRISVAAFREAQSRRSLAGSPSPSFGRSPSPLPNSPSLPPEVQRGPPPNSRVSRANMSTSPSPQSYTTPLQNRRKSGMSFAATSLFASDTDDSDSPSEQAESDDDDTYTSARRGRTTVASAKGRAKSDLGHGSLLARRSQVARSASKSHSRHDWSPATQPPLPQSRPKSQAWLSTSYTAEEAPPRSQSSMDQYNGATRPRASASTSALTPSTAAKRASIIATANASAGMEADVVDQYKRASGHVRDSSIHSTPGDSAVMTSRKASTHLGHGYLSPQQAASSDSDSDSDNAPLATLMQPRRPGSAMSSYSNGNTSTRSGGLPHKPLIDIKELTGGPTVANKSGLAPTVHSPPKSMEGFTGGRTLLSASANTPRSDLSSSATSHSRVSQAAPVKFSSPPSSPGQDEMRRGIPPRSSTMPLPMTSTPGLGGKENTPLEGKRDALSERLSKVVKTTVGPSHLNPERSSSVPALSISRSTTIINDTRPTQALTQDPESPSRRSVFLESQRSLSPTGSARLPAQIPPVQRRKPSTPDMSTSTSSATIRGRPLSRPSSPDSSLADLLGAAGMKLISRNGESSSSDSDSDDSSGSSESESDEYGHDTLTGRKGALKGGAPRSGGDQMKEEEKITPIPIRQRQPAPSFSVTSRPQVPRSPTKQANALSTVSNGSGSSSGGSVLGFASTTKSPVLNSNLTQSTAFNATRKRSSTLVPSTSPPSFLSPSSSFVTSNNSSARGTPPPPDGPSKAVSDRTSALRAVGATLAMQPQPRQRSSTLVPMMSPQSGTPPPMPSRPFAVRRDSPASSTGDSSSGRAPLTPRDGSDIVVKDGKKRIPEQGQYSGGASGLGISSAKAKAKMKRRSVSFEEELLRDGGDYRSSRGFGRDVASRGSGEAGAKKRSVELELEERRKERRREEAKAAIELGEVVNGRGPLLSDDDDDDLPMNQINPRMSTMNPMMMNPMGMQPSMGYPGGMSPAWGMNMNMAMQQQQQQAGGTSGMLSPAQFMLPQPATADPSFMAAHQQAMMFAKQAYQMAVAQQAMVAAADEWERSSNMGGYGGGSVYGGGGGSVGAQSMIGPYAMNMGMGANMNMGMGMPGNWSTGSAIMPPSSRAMYGGGISSSRSEYGGGGGMMASGRNGSGGQMQQMGWSSSRSSHGDRGVPGGGSGRGRYVSAGPGAGGRESIYGGMNSLPVPGMPSNGNGGAKIGGAGGGQRQRTASQPVLNPRGGATTGVRKAAPPSSWKASGF